MIFWNHNEDQNIKTSGVGGSMPGQFSHIIVGIVVGLLSPLAVKCLEFYLEYQKKLLNEQFEARKNIIGQCIGEVTMVPRFYEKEDFMIGIFPQIKPELYKLNKQLVREIEELAEGRSRKSSEEIEQIRKKFIEELVKLKRKWNLI